MGLFQRVVSEGNSSIDGLVGIAFEISPFKAWISRQVVGVTGDVNPNIGCVIDLHAAVGFSGDFAINRIDVNDLHEFNVIANHLCFGGQHDSVTGRLNLLPFVFGGGFHNQIELRVFSRVSGADNVVRETAKHFAIELAFADRIANAAKTGPRIQGTAIVLHRFGIVSGSNPDIGERAIITKRQLTAEVLGGDTLHAIRTRSEFFIAIGLSYFLKVFRSNTACS